MTYFDADKVHLNTAGHAIAGAAISSAMLSLMAPTAGILTAGTPTTTTIPFTWTAGSDGVGSVSAQLEISSDNSTWANVTGATTSPATVTALTAGTTYYFRVAYTDQTPTTVYSNVAMATTGAALAAGTLTAGTPTTTTIPVTIGLATSGYGTITSVVQISSDGGSTYTNATVSGGSVTGLTAGTAYKLRVEYTDDTPTKVYSNVIEATTLAGTYVSTSAGVFKKDVDPATTSAGTFRRSR